ncbi:hypothetical protein DFJ58DRAFT_772162 [Suillus subalutaceus]|uniref:uncharacterized protein n=1 Tax=Suillus subalutaceus TaxID=48586 RepID=UPI001B87C6D6|nr:uncharacterized protein DFJ58DRAFT_772162 [Suillus subalutaceus]KAG1865048.1 hypothetical protein DFJ58DRAFT_772162 [Suillus subalutaceus]
MALCHLYCNRILQGHPPYGFIGQGSTDYFVFRRMLERAKVKDNVVIATTKLFVAKYKPPFVSWSSPKFGACPDPVLEWLSHALPFHFVTGRVDEDVEKLAITVISKLLSSPSSPSPQIIANCTLLACVMVGIQFDKKDIVRVDKSSALHQLAESIWAQFRKAFWALDGSDLDSDSTGCRRAWDLTDVICRMLQLGLPDPPPSQEMWNLGVCRKIYSRARSSERHQSAALRKVQRFRFAVVTDESRWDPAWLWQHQISWKSNSHSPKDFDWLVDYLGDICSNDHETAGDILVLLSSMRVNCSPAKQHQYIEKLIACMGSSMPPRLRHAALRAAHSSREVLAFINVVDDADMVLTKFSPAILTAVCPQPGATSTDGGPDCFFHPDRDLYYLELIFALAKNSYWRPHLHCQIDRAIRMIAVCCESPEPHAFYLAGIFLRMTLEQVSATSLSSITDQQWWNMMKKAWWSAFLIMNNARCIEFLPVLVEGTKKYMCIASKYDLEQLIRRMDRLIVGVEMRGVDVAVKELRGIANDMLAKFSS